MKTIISLALVALLAACGGGGSDTPSAQPQAARPAPLGDVVIYGDSIGVTEGAELAKIMPGVVNRSRGGMHLHQFIDERMDDEALTAARQAVVIAYGTNDARLDGVGYYTAPQFQAALYDVAAAVKAMGARVVLETPPQTVAGGSSVGIFGAGSVEPYAVAVRAVGLQLGLTVCDRWARTEGVTLADMPDGVHPVGALAASNAAALAGCIKEAPAAPKVTP